MLSLHGIYLHMESQQQLLQGPKHNCPQKTLMSVTVCVLAERQPVTLMHILYEVFCCILSDISHTVCHTSVTRIVTVQSTHLSSDLIHNVLKTIQ